jgi:hypothetical protein
MKLKIKAKFVKKCLITLLSHSILNHNFIQNMNTKKEIRNSYKQLKFRAGIFQIKNSKTNRLFLKTSTDLDKAFNSDKFQLKAGLHTNSDLQNDWSALGADSFEFEVLDELKFGETATELEIRKDLKEFLALHCKQLLENGAILY